MLGQLCCALQPCVAEMANLKGIKLIPPVIMELGVEIGHELGADEIDEGVAHVAAVLDS
jgi:hypothetical protein